MSTPKIPKGWYRVLHFNFTVRGDRKWDSWSNEFITATANIYISKIDIVIRRKVKPAQQENPPHA